MSGNRRSTLALLYPALAATVLLAGCADESVGPNTAAQADAGLGARKPLATLEWNRLALGMIEKHKPNQQAALRGMAYLTLAQYGAAEAAGDAGPKPNATLGAVAGASAVVLSYLHPVDAPAFEAEVFDVAADGPPRLRRHARVAARPLRPETCSKQSVRDGCVWCGALRALREFSTARPLSCADRSWRCGGSRGRSESHRLMVPEGTSAARQWLDDHAGCARCSDRNATG